MKVFPFGGTGTLPQQDQPRDPVPGQGSCAPVDVPPMIRDTPVMTDADHPAEKRSINELLAESKRLSELSDKIRRQMDELTAAIARRAAELDKTDGAKNVTPPPWTFDSNPPNGT